MHDLWKFSARLTVEELLRFTNEHHHRELAHHRQIHQRRSGRPNNFDFDTLVKEMRKVAGPGRVTTVSYSGLKFAFDLQNGHAWISQEWHYTLAAVIRDQERRSKKIRLQQEIFASRQYYGIYFEGMGEEQHREHGQN